MALLYPRLRPFLLRQRTLSAEGSNLVSRRLDVATGMLGQESSGAREIRSSLTGPNFIAADGLHEDYDSDRLTMSTRVRPKLAEAASFAPVLGNSSHGDHSGRTSMMSDLGDFMGYSLLSTHNQCELSDADQSSVSARLYMPIANWALRYTPSPSVALIYIDPSHDPPDLLTNVCASRVFLARLIKDVASLGAHVIAIDKYYSKHRLRRAGEERCVRSMAMNSSKIPVVVGQADHALPDSAQGAGCLRTRLHGSSSAKTLMVQYGIVRLDTDVLRIPLRWLWYSPILRRARPALHPYQSSCPIPAAIRWHW